jgi:hypothetical protein
MTTLFDPTSGPILAPVSYDLRDAYLRPPDVQLVLPGALFCPNDDVLLLARTAGWYCPSCFGGWDGAGRRGRWLPIRDTVLRSATERRLRLIDAEDPLAGRGCDNSACRPTCGNCRPELTSGADDQPTASTTPAGGRLLDEQVVDARVIKDDDQVDAVDAAARLRRTDRLIAGMTGLGAVCGSGYAVGVWLRPWEHLVPDALLWQLIGVLGVAGAAVLVVMMLRHRLAAHRAAEWGFGPGGEVSDGR